MNFFLINRIYLQNCGSYFTAVLYVEHWCEEKFNCLTLGNPDFSHLELVSQFFHEIQDHVEHTFICK